jgi:hypothetical protein
MSYLAFPNTVSKFLHVPCISIQGVLTICVVYLTFEI